MYKLIAFLALFCYGPFLKKTIWPRGDLNPRSWCQSTDMLASRPSYIPKKGCIKPKAKPQCLFHDKIML